MVQKEKIYFAHPVNVFWKYNPKLKAKILEKIKKQFPAVEIIDPDKQEHQDGYEKYKELYGNGMKYYSEVVLPQCTGCIFLAFRDRMIGKGVFTEVNYFFEKSLCVWEINPSSFEITEVEQDESYYQRCLNVSETRKRIRDSEGDSRPY